MSETGPAPVRHPWLGGADLAVGAGLLGGVWFALPARWWLVDAVGTSLGVLLLVAGAGLLAGSAWSQRAGVLAGGAALAVGLTLVSALAVTASHLAGLYGPVGEGGALILVVVALLVAPYLVALPIAQLLTLRKR